MHELIAGLIGVGIGALGTLIGAGGGFLLAPLILFVEPEWPTEVVTAFSIAVVAANANAGAFSYWRMRRIDLRSFPFFALAAAPGAAFGALLTAVVPRAVFDIVFGITLLGIGAWLVLRPPHVGHGDQRDRPAKRTIVDAHGNRYAWSFDFNVGLVGAAFVGFLSSILGIGGGIVHVPFMVAILNFPEHVATATSHAVLAVTALIATLVHLVHGDYGSDWTLVVATSVGAMLGAPLGARLSNVVPGRIILRILGAGLVFVAIRLLVPGR